MADTLILTVELASGDFKTQMRVQLTETIDNDAVVAQWLDFIQTGFRIGALKMDGSLKITEKADG